MPHVVEVKTFYVIITPSFQQIRGVNYVDGKMVKHKSSFVYLNSTEEKKRADR